MSPLITGASAGSTVSVGGISLPAAEPAIKASGQAIVAQTHDRVIAASSLASTSGELRVSAIALVAGQVVTNLLCIVGLAGAGMTHGYLCLYSVANPRLALSADSPTSFQGTGLITLAMTVAYTVPATGLYYAGFLGTTGTSMPNIVGVTNGTTAATIAVGTGSAPMTHQTGLTSPPDPMVPSAGAVNPFWIGVT